MPGSPPVDPPGCICEPWKDDGKGHWVRVVNPNCPVHGRDDEE